MLYRILVVDDEELITDSLAGMLAEAPQYELDVYKAYSGSEALELLNEQQFDIVVSDICMPGISGIGAGAENTGKMAALSCDLPDRL